ncbi:GlpM family protein [Brevibacillus ginsengisoli]|uniref:GlpM family protein n=1 Tax=Brevibacillus ginsengisoli TaxID=363854 RepID=UPI003CEBDB25
MFEYVIKFVIGGTILVLASYFSKSKNLFLAGIITTLPIMTLVNMIFQMKYLNPNEFQQAQKSGIFGAIGLLLFMVCCYLLTSWFKPSYAVLISIGILCVYILIFKQLS